MAADLARITYDPTRQYRSVISQQGRVTLEADSNEAAVIASEALRLETIDIVGPTGTPDDGYKVGSGTGPGGVSIGPGMFYLGGWRLQRDTAIDLSKQPDWLDAPAATVAQGNMVVSLLLTEQSVCAVEDQALREVALGGPDSAARARLMQQFLRLATTADTCPAGATMIAQTLTAEGVTIDPATLQLMSAARLQAGFVPGPPNTDPCAPTAAGGYLGADNQLVRVTVIAYNAVANTGTLLWSWNNASLLYRAGVTDPRTLTLQGAPVDEEHAPQLGQAVEILRCRSDLTDGNYIAAPEGFVTTLTQAYSFDTGTLGLADALPAEYQADATAKLPLFVRLWQAKVSFIAGQLTPLDGVSGLAVTITLPALPATIALRPFWRFAVRPSTPVQIYPQTYQEKPQPPDGPRQWLTDLAVVTAQASGSTLVADCRVPFVPLTQQQSGACCSLVLGQKDVAGRGGLQAVMDGLAGTQSSVALLAGTYTLPEPLVLGAQHSGLTLEACGPGVVLVANPNNLTPFRFGLIVLEAAANVTLRGLGFTIPNVPVPASTTGAVNANTGAATLATNTFSTGAVLTEALARNAPAAATARLAPGTFSTDAVVLNPSAANTAATGALAATAVDPGLRMVGPASAAAAATGTATPGASTGGAATPGAPTAGAATSSTGAASQVTAAASAPAAGATGAAAAPAAAGPAAPAVAASGAVAAHPPAATTAPSAAAPAAAGATPVAATGPGTTAPAVTGAGVATQAPGAATVSATVAPVAATTSGIATVPGVTGAAAAAQVPASTSAPATTAPIAATIGATAPVAATLGATAPPTAGAAASPATGGVTGAGPAVSTATNVGALTLNTAGAVAANTAGAVAANTAGAVATNAAAPPATSIGVLAVASPGLTVEACHFSTSPASAQTFGAGLFVLGNATGLSVRRNSFVASGYQSGAAVFGMLVSVLNANVTTTLDSAEISDNLFQLLPAGLVTFAQLGLVRCANNRVVHCGTGLYFAASTLGATTEVTRQALGDATQSATLSPAMTAGMQPTMLAAMLTQATPFVAKAPAPAANTVSDAARTVLLQSVTTRATTAFHSLSISSDVVSLSATLQHATPQVAASAPAIDAAISQTSTPDTVAAQAAAPQAAAVAVDPAMTNALNLVRDVSVAAEVLGTTLTPVLHISGNDVALIATGTTPGVGIAMVLSPRDNAFGVVLMTANRVVTADPITEAAAMLFPTTAAVTGNVFIQAGAITDRRTVPAFMLIGETAARIEVAANIIHTTSAIVPARANTAPTTTWNFLNTVG